MNTTYHGAAVLVALLPILPLAMYLRRRHAARRPHGAVVVGAASLSLLVAGLGIALATGAF